MLNCNISNFNGKILAPVYPPIEDWDTYIKDNLKYDRETTEKMWIQGKYSNF